MAAWAVSSALGYAEHATCSTFCRRGSTHPPPRIARQRHLQGPARGLIAVPVAVTDPPAEHDDADLDASAAADHRPLCPCCGGRMIIVESFGRGGAPRGPPSPRSRGQDRDAMTPVTASSISRLPGKPRFRRRIAVAPPPPTARPMPSIRLKLPCRLPQWRQTRHRDRRSAADYAGQRIPNASRRIVKSP